VTENGEKAIGIGMSESKDSERGEIRTSEDAIKKAQWIRIVDSETL